ncbi:hypothetical protein Dimus_025881 [Dionaea muscipula]
MRSENPAKMGSLTQLLIPLFSLLILLSNPSTAAAAAFKCSSTTTCTALIQYVSPNSTTLSAIQNLFDINNLLALLGANSLPLNTRKTYFVPANTPINVPFPCICSNGTGISNHVPIYTVVSGDYLYLIASQIFLNLVTVDQIQTVNNIVNASLIEIGQKLWIPLPCSCDEVGGETVVHDGYVVPSGASLAEIATDYGTTEATLETLNGITDPTKLLAGQILDVPIKACSLSSSNSSSLDSKLLVANGTYTLTANGCVQCICSSANNYTLHCQPSQLEPSRSKWSTCPSTLCGNGLNLGNTTSSGCNITTCTYNGYTNDTILTTTVTTVNSTGNSTCSAHKSHASRVNLGGWSSIAAVFCLVHLELLYLLQFW